MHGMTSDVECYSSSVYCLQLVNSIGCHAVGTRCPVSSGMRMQLEVKVHKLVLLTYQVVSGAGNDGEPARSTRVACSEQCAMNIIVNTLKLATELQTESQAPCLSSHDG